MLSIRAKLVALALGSFVPALVGAIATERESERELLDEAGGRIKQVGRHFDELLAEYEMHALLAVEFAAHDRDFHEALFRAETQSVQRFVDQIASGFPSHGIVASNQDGDPIALGNPEYCPKSIRAELSPAFARVLQREPVSGLYPLGEGYAFVDATPVLHGSVQVGALALITPVNDEYLALLAAQLDADLVLSVADKVISTSPDHAAPSLRTRKEEVLFQEDHSHLFAVETFHPQKLQQKDLSIELTATRDVSQLRATARNDLMRHLGLLAGAAVIFLTFALRYARRTASAIEGIAGAAKRLKAGSYEKAPLIKTNDELELLAHSYNEMVEGLEERDRLKETFGRYVTRQVAEHLMLHDQQLGGELVPVTVLFSDIRAFTTISEQMNPRELLDFLNEYFTGMVESILTNHGVVDKFIGDAIMAVFGAPVPEPDDPMNAVRAAIHMRQSLRKINQHFRERELPEIRTGIGLHYGQVVAGNMGHSDRMEYTVIGDTVNVASRLEGMTKELACDILISGDLHDQVKAGVEAEPLKQIQVKGREEPIMVYRVIGLKSSRDD